MLIILEGTDATGKSTLARRLSEMYGYPIKHFSYPTSEEESKAMFDMYRDFVKTGGNWIVDRAWYSEMVYGNIIRTKSHITVGQMVKLERLVEAHGGGMIIHCTAPLEAIWGRFSARGDDLIPPNKATIRDLKEGYDALMNETTHKLPVFTYEI